MMRCIAKKVYTLATETNDEEALIRFANAMSETHLGESLDSLDLGDSMGFFMRYADMLQSDNEYMGDVMLVSPEGFTVTISTEDELFRWEGTSYGDSDNG